VRFPFKVNLSKDHVRGLVRNALREDLGDGDITTDSTVDRWTRVEAKLRLKDRGVIAGALVFDAVFADLDPAVRVKWSTKEGRIYKPGRLLARLSGRARSILTGERVALNLLQRLSGIATVTRGVVDEVRGTGVKIVDTRKTTPGLRRLEKYAVLVGGGHNHRLTLSGLALIKDNHIEAAGGIAEAVERVRRARTGVPVEVEVGPHVDLRSLEKLDVDIVMLDNWPLRRLARAIRIVKAMPSKPLVEVSGGITLRNVRRIAECGPDVISVGYLTHSAPSLDISLDF
jgi:nicotinate-nucleotide pyrophosphorylase (carboxylating)